MAIAEIDCIRSTWSPSAGSPAASHDSKGVQERKTLSSELTCHLHHLLLDKAKYSAQQIQGVEELFSLLNGMRGKITLWNKVEYGTGWGVITGNCVTIYLLMLIWETHSSLHTQTMSSH